MNDQRGTIYTHGHHESDPVQALRGDEAGLRAGGHRRGPRRRLRGVRLVPQLPALDSWLDLYERAARGNGGEPDAGRRLPS